MTTKSAFHESVLGHYLTYVEDLLLKSFMSILSLNLCQSLKTTFKSAVNELLKSSQVKQFYSELKSHNVTHGPTYIQHLYSGNNNLERNIEKKVLEKRQDCEG